MNHLPLLKTALLSSFVACAGFANANDRFWSGGTDTTFSTAGNWDTLPNNNTTDDVGVFTGAPTANQPNVTGTRSINGLRFESAGWTLSSGAVTLSLGSGGLDSAGAGINTVSARIAIAGTVGAWDIGAGNTLDFNGLLSGTVATAKEGLGTLELSGTVANTWSGALTVNGGLVLLNSNGVNSLGGVTGRSITVNNGGTVRWGAAAVGNQIASTTTQFTVASGGLVDLNGKSESFAFSGNEKITLSGGTVDTNGGLWTFTGNNSGAGAIVNGTTVSTILGRVSFGGATADRGVNVSNNAVGLDLNWLADIEVGDQLTFTAPAADSGSQISLGGNNAITGNISLSNGVTLFLDHANAAGVGVGVGANLVNGGSTLAVRGSLDYGETGNTTIQFTKTPGLQSVSGNNTWNGAISNPGGSSALPGVVRVDADSLRLTATLGGFSSDSRQLAKTGDGALLYANANNFNATLYVDGGTFAYANSGQANVRGGNTALNGGTLASPDNLTMALGTGSTQYRFGGAGGGFAAYGADITVSGNRVWGGATVAQTPGAAITGDQVTSINHAGIYFYGAGYANDMAVSFTGGGGSGATATLQANAAGAITGFTITNPGSGYTSAPTVVLPAIGTLGDGGTANFLANNAPLILNSIVSAHKVTLTGTLDLAASGAAYTGEREIRVLDNPNATTDRAVIGGLISSSKAGVGIQKTGAGILELTANNTYGGQTLVSDGTLLVQGNHSGTGAVTVGAGGTLGGSGRVGGAILGAGLVSPGNSPGIFAAASVKGSEGTDFSFEFGQEIAPTWSVATASGNDVLRLTAATPFVDPLDDGNVVDLYFADYGTYQGGFYTDANGNFSAQVANATFNFFLEAPGGSKNFEGKSYNPLSPLDLSLSTYSMVQVANADFAGGPVANGWTMQFAVIPEPGSLALLALGLGCAALLRHRRR